MTGFIAQSGGDAGVNQFDTSQVPPYPLLKSFLLSIDPMWVEIGFIAAVYVWMTVPLVRSKQHGALLALWGFAALCVLFDWFLPSQAPF